MAETSGSRKDLVPKYFVTTPDEPKGGEWGSGVMAMGAVIALAGLLLLFSGGGDAACFSLIMLVGGAFAAWMGFTAWSSRSTRMAAYQETLKRAEPKPTDKQMDAWLKGDIAKLKGEALKKLDLESEQLMQPEPLLIVGPANQTAVAVGKDGTIRFSKYDIVVIYLTDYHLAAYEGSLDMASGNTTSESTQEYHYADVVSVATQTGNLFNIEVNGEKKSIDTYQKFALAVASGDHIDVVVAFPQKDQIQEFLSTGEFPPSGAEEAIRTIRARLREKKGGTQA
jgi:hypothetical protein